MKFGEKIQTLRKQNNISQKELAELMNVSLRTVRGWESENRYPRKRELYQQLADILHCSADYLLTEKEDFIAEAGEQFGARGAAQAQAILDQTAAMFAGGELSDEDQLAFLTEIQSLYLDSKKRARKYSPKKYTGDSN